MDCVASRGIPLAPFGDAIAPGLAVAQAVGRWGNWFNQELFGGPTDLPWGLEIDVAHRPVEYLDVPTFHPTFLYESLWLLVVAVVLVARRSALADGPRTGLCPLRCSLHRRRLAIELIRVDPANEILGLRVNVWVSIMLFVASVAYLVISARRDPGEKVPTSCAPIPPQRTS